jgi:ATP-dependent RNA helicase RhlE
MPFSQLGLSTPLQKAIRDSGYTTPTPIQLQAIGPVLAGRDLLGCAQTGTGKTAAFALPILDRLVLNTTNASKDRGFRGPRPIRVLVLTPTRELAAQVGESFRTYGKHLPQIASTVIFGGVGQMPQVQALHRGVDIVVACPGRLLDLINQGHVKLDKVGIFVLDEADRMLDMGFIPDIRRIVALLPAQRQNLMFSATMPPPIRELASGILNDPVSVAVAAVSSAAETVDQRVFHIDFPYKQALLNHLLQDPSVGRALVFTRTKHGADKVVRHLERVGLKSAAIHGNKSQNARIRALEDFRKGQVKVLVASDIAARGLDIDAITHVINLDIPHEAETYVHRIGRTGRAGATGQAWSLCSPDERQDWRAIERLINRAIPSSPIPAFPPIPRNPDGEAPDRPVRHHTPPRKPERTQDRSRNPHRSGHGQPERRNSGQQNRPGARPNRRPRN